MYLLYLDHLIQMKFKTESSNLRSATQILPVFFTNNCIKMLINFPKGSIMLHT